MVEAAPAASLIVAEADLLLQLLIIPLDPPALHGVADQRGAADMGWQRREPELAGLDVSGRPFDQAPFLGSVRVGGGKSGFSRDVGLGWPSDLAARVELRSSHP